MSQPSIQPVGGQKVTFVGSKREAVQFNAQETAEITRPNVHGRARKKIGRRGTSMQVFFSLDVERADYDENAKEIRDHQGQFVLFTDSLGNVETLHADKVEVDYDPAEKVAGGLINDPAKTVVRLRARYVLSDTRASQ